jgi:hypothetical protein
MSGRTSSGASPPPSMAPHTSAGAGEELVVGFVVRVTIPEGSSFPLGGEFPLREGDELLGLVQQVAVRRAGGATRVKSYDIHGFGLTSSLTEDGTALRQELLRELALSTDLNLGNVPRDWVSEARVDNLTARFDAALSRRAGMDVLLAHQRPRVAEPYRSRKA